MGQRRLKSGLKMCRNIDHLGFLMHHDGLDSGSLAHTCLTHRHEIHAGHYLGRARNLGPRPLVCPICARLGTRDGDAFQVEGFKREATRYFGRTPSSKAVQDVRIGCFRVHFRQCLVASGMFSPGARGKHRDTSLHKC